MMPELNKENETEINNLASFVEIDKAHKATKHTGTHRNVDIKQVRQALLWRKRYK